MRKKKNKSFKHRLNAIKNWWNFKKKLFHLWWADAPKSQRFLEKGNYYLRRGAVVQVGQPINIQGQHGIRKRYIKNLFFDFRKNKITCSYSDKPIKEFTEEFES